MKCNTIIYQKEKYARVSDLTLMLYDVEKMVAESGKSATDVLDALREQFKDWLDN